MGTFVSTDGRAGSVTIYAIFFSADMITCNNNTELQISLNQIGCTAFMHFVLSS